MIWIAEATRPENLPGEPARSANRRRQAAFGRLKNGLSSKGDLRQ